MLAHRKATPSIKFAGNHLYVNFCKDSDSDKIELPDPLGVKDHNSYNMYKLNNRRKSARLIKQYGIIIISYCLISLAYFRRLPIYTPGWREALWK